MRHTIAITAHVTPSETVIKVASRRTVTYGLLTVYGTFNSEPN
jgi:hypothetical protein